MSTGNPSIRRQPPEWEKHENEITELLVDQQKTLREVMELMSVKHGFHATERQYKYRFGCLKNVDSGEWAWVADEVRRRAALGKKTAVYLRGQPLPQERVSRGITRIQRKGVSSRAEERTSGGRRKTKDANRITFRTPSPAPVPPSPAANLPHENAEATPPTRLSEGRTTVATRLEPSVDDGAIITGSNVDANGLTAAQPDLAYQPGSPRVPEPPLASRPHAAANAIRPSRIQGFKRNLPFFEVLSAIDWPASLMSNCPNLRTKVSGSLATSARFCLLVATWDLFSGLFDLASSGPMFPATAASLAEFVKDLQLVIPERFSGDLLQTFQRIMDPSLPISTVVLWPFAAAAFLSSNDFMKRDKLDAFLRFVVGQGQTEPLLRFMNIQLPTVYTFIEAVFVSAIRTGNVQLLNAMLDSGIDPGSYHLSAIVYIGNADLTRRILSRMGTADRGSQDFSGGMEGSLRVLVCQEQFDVAEILLKTPDVQTARGWWLAALRQAIWSNDIQEARSLLKIGANVGLELSSDDPYGMSLDVAIGRQNMEMVNLFWENGATMPLRFKAMPTLGWLRLYDRGIFDLVTRMFALDPTGFLLDDALDAANLGRPALETYISSQEYGVTAHQLEKTLEESIRRNRVNAAISLLQYGVDPNGSTLAPCPLVAALSAGENKAVFIELLLHYQADVGRLTIREITTTSELLGVFLRSEPVYGRKMEALMIAAESGNIVSASMLLLSLSANDIDRPWPTLNALQLAARGGRVEMIHFLINRGADVNAPASPHEGRTALQGALSGLDGSLDVAKILLRYGADVRAPPALMNGVTILEAISRHYTNNGLSDEREVGDGVRGGRDGEQFFHKLLDAGAAVNRPSGESSSVLHGVIERGWHKTLRRCLEPHHKTIANHMCRCDIIRLHPDDDRYEGQLTPTQLAAYLGDLEAVKVLLTYGVDVNEAPSDNGGLTALQAAASRKPGGGKMRLVHFLLNHGADINANPAKQDGATALQAAAMAGDLSLAELLVVRGAKVKAEGSDGRTAIEWALEHNRLDMVQLLVNAAAVGA